MPDVTAFEAKALLSQRLSCEDCSNWVAPKNQSRTFRIAAGPTDTLGQGTSLSVELVCYRSEKSVVRSYLFTVLRHKHYATERVYQLEIIQTEKVIKDIHKRSHEHFGNTRSPCPERSVHWDYDEVLAYFCRRTNLSFLPSPPDPLRFY